jgi:hypothetical protein
MSKIGFIEVPMEVLRGPPRMTAPWTGTEVELR